MYQLNENEYLEKLW